MVIITAFHMFKKLSRDMKAIISVDEDYNIWKENYTRLINRRLDIAEEKNERLMTLNK